jgi:transcriptional regulator with XRE-family HTH domain
MQTEQTKTVHQGRNVKRIREILGVKQETLAHDLGLTQQAVSQLEQKEALDKELLEKIAEILKVPPEAIKNFNEEATFNILSNTYNDQSASVNYFCDINPIEKWLEAIEENKKLYEQLLKAEREKNVLLERMLNERK